MHGAAQSAGALAVDDPDLQDALCPAFGKIVGHQVLYLRRVKTVQIKHPVNGYLDRFLVILFHVG